MGNNLYNFSVFSLIFIIAAIVLYLLSLNIDDKIRSTFFWGALFKIVFALFLGLVFEYYYGWGDTFTFFKFGISVREILDQDATQFQNLILNGNHTQYPSLAHPLVSNKSFIFMKNLTALMSYFSFKSYLGTSLLTALFSFAGSWYLYIRLLKIYAGAYKTLGIVLFFLPSIAFWTSGLLKDTIVLGCFTFFIGAMLDLIKFKRRRIFSLIIIYACYMAIHVIKSYVADSLLLCSILYLFYNSILKIPSRASRSLLYAVLFMGIVVLLIVFNTQIEEYVQKALIEEFLGEAIDKQNNYHYAARETSSSYSLGVDLYENTNVDLLTVLQLFPIAVATTLFRPFIWEAHKLIVMISALENLAILGVTIFVLLKVGIFNFFKIIFDDSFLTFLFIFVLIFAFAVGIATGNFGALSRYRTPGMALYFPLLYLVYYKYQIRKNEKRLHR